MMMKLVLLLVLLALVNASWNTFEKKKDHVIERVLAAKRPPAKKPPVPAKKPVKKPVRAPVRAPVKAPTPKAPTPKAPTPKAPTPKAPTPAPQSKVIYREMYKDETCGTSMSQPHPFMVSGNVANVCGLNDDGTKAQMWVMKSTTEVGYNTYNGLTCTGTNKYKKVVDVPNGVSTACMSAGPGYSYKGFATTLPAMLQKYSSLNGPIVLNYASRTCSGQYPSIDIQVYEPCMPVTDRDNKPTGYMTLIFNAAGAHQSMFNLTDPTCVQAPLYEYDVGYASMGNFGNCSASDDTHDNYKYNIVTTHYLMH